MPMTVPKSPMNGAMAAIVASQVIRLSMLVRASLEAVLSGALESDRVAGEAASAVLALVLIVNLGEDCDERAGLELIGYGCDLAEACGFAKGAEEALALRLCFAKAGPLREHDGPREDAGQEQDDKNGKGYGTAIVNHLHEGAGVGGHGRCGRGIFLEEVHCKGESPDHSYCPPVVSVNRDCGK